MSALAAAPLDDATIQRKPRRRSLLRGLDPITIGAFVVVVIAVLWTLFPAVFATHSPIKISKDLLAAPSAAHWLGTDEVGRDIYSRIVHGARIDLQVSALGVLLAVLIGVPMGLVSGYLGGFSDSVLMRLQDALLAFPSILFAILVVAAMGASRWSIILTVAVIFVPRFARVVRGTAMALKHEEFVTASRASGGSPARIIFRHILPNTMAPILVQVTWAMAVAILIEAGLSYLGLGVQPPTPTWGTMLKAAQAYPSQAPWYVIAPGACIFLLVLSLNIIGDTLRDRLDPRLRSR